MEIEGYRSIRKRIEVILDPRVTVILGANDHGKTNFIEAITHLNDDAAFEAEFDLNWDCDARDADLPYVLWEFTLDEEEKGILAAREEAERNIAAAQDLVAEAGEAAQKAQEAYDEAKSHAAEAASSEEAGADLPPEDADSGATGKDPQQLERESAVEARQAELEDARLRLALLIAEEARVRAAATGQNVDTAVEDWAKRSASLARSAATALTKATAKLEGVQEEAASAEASGDQAALQRAQGEVQAASKAAEAAQADLTLKQRVAAQGQAAAEAVASGAVSDLPPREVNSVKTEEIPNTLAVERKGLEGSLAVIVPDSFCEESVRPFFADRLPRVELISPAQTLPDSVTRANVSNPEQAFMRGVFYYAGLDDQEAWDDLFAQNYVTTRRLREASDILNGTLKASWSQGEGLTFRLVHNSAKKTIDLQIEDPAVTATDVRASRRSSGFTHFFALKTILHSRRAESPARSYLWLFDEPGVFLHPDGQHDLLQVLETLAQANQIIYTTHSIFMVNKNYPARHRLLVKSKQGTVPDAKPFVGQWKPALDALGLSLPGTILFASNVLLVEGDSDPILLNAVLQKLIEAGEYDVDVNTLSIMATGESKHADALIRILTDSTIKPKIVALFDGDAGGRERHQALEELMKDRKITSKILTTDTSTEDHLLEVEALFPLATARYVAKVSGKPEDELLTALQASYAEAFGQGKVTAGVAKWAREGGKRLGDLEQEPSSVGIAREYCWCWRRPT